MPPKGKAPKKGGDDGDAPSGTARCEARSQAAHCRLTPRLSVQFGQGAALWSKGGASVELCHSFFLDLLPHAQVRHILCEKQSKILEALKAR